MIVRPVTSADLPALIELARSTGTGLTTLPANEQRLQHRVSWAEKAFRGEAERGDADYLFVLEDDAGKVVGISAIAESQNLVLAVGTPGDDAEPYLIHNRKREDCRITAAPARAAAGTLVVDPLTAKRLRLSAGASVRAVPLSAQKRG